jgi:hypothetical protein
MLLPNSSKQLLKTWIKATLDSNTASKQTNIAVAWMAELSMTVGISLRLESSFSRSYYNNQSLIAELLGRDDKKNAHWGPEMALKCGNRQRQRIFDTMSMGTASIGIAAAANGANVSVECFLKDGSQFIPSVAKQTPTLFLVRLWLCQPPVEICASI